MPQTAPSGDLSAGAVLAAGAAATAELALRLPAVGTVAVTALVRLRLALTVVRTAVGLSLAIGFRAIG